MSEGGSAPVVEWTRRLGAHIEASRQRARMTRVELAGRMQVSEETIRRWERGSSRPSDDRLVKLIAVLALDGAELQLASGGDDELPALARRLREERAERRITQAQAATLLGVAQPTYAGWEVGRSLPEAARVADIAEFLGVPGDEAAALTATPFVVDVSEWPPLGRIMGTRREALRLTRSELADRVGVTRSTIVNWELGYRVPRVQQLSQLAAVLSVRVSRLAEALPDTGRPLTALGNVIRARQSALGLTRAEIARRAGTDEATLSRWANGHREPNETGLRRLAAALEVPFSALAGPS